MKSEQKMFIVKYSLSNKGVISTANCEIAQDSQYAYERGRFCSIQYKIGRDAFADEGEARSAFEKLRTKKIASHKAAIARLEKMTAAID